jgi:hypothetical protein
MDHHLAQFPPFTIPTNFTLSRTTMFIIFIYFHFHFHRFMVVKGRGEKCWSGVRAPGITALSNPQGQHTEKQSSLHLLAKMSRGKANKKNILCGTNQVSKKNKK